MDWTAWVFFAVEALAVYLFARFGLKKLRTQAGRWFASVLLVLFGSCFIVDALGPVHAGPSMQVGLLIGTVFAGGGLAFAWQAIRSG